MRSPAQLAFMCFLVTSALVWGGAIRTAYGQDAADAQVPEAGEDGEVEEAGEAGEAGDDGAPPGPPTMTPGAILAHYCGDAEMKCMTTPVNFSYTHRLFPQLPNWDTGWIPEGSEMLQVRFALKIPTDTQVDLGGQFQAVWPDALTLSTPGDRFGGFVKFDYGLVIESLGKININVGGSKIVSWEGELPYLPNFKFHLLGERQFDTWMFAPEAVTANAFTARATLFEINVLALAKIPSEIVKGGVALDVRGELQATYRTEQIKFNPEAKPITSQDGTTVLPFAGGPYVEIDVIPQGRINYAGIIHLIPTFWVKVANFKDISIPFYDYPVDITKILNLDLGQTIPFDKVTVHVPLPDIPRFVENATLDFGKVVVGSSEQRSFEIPNEGEAKARLRAEVEATMKKNFKVQGTTATIAPGSTKEIGIRFSPKKPGLYVAKMTINSNDPDNPTQVISLRGQAYSSQDALDNDDTDDWSDEDEQEKERLEGNDTLAGDDGGCGCRLADTNDNSHGALPWWLLGCVSMTAAVARKRTTRHQRRTVQRTR